MQGSTLMYLRETKPQNDHIVKYTEAVNQLVSSGASYDQLSKELEKSPRTIERWALIGRLSPTVKRVIEANSENLTITDLIRMVVSKKYNTDERRLSYISDIVNSKGASKVKPKLQVVCTSKGEQDVKSTSPDPIVNVHSLKKTWWLLLLVIPFEIYTSYKLKEFFGSWGPALLPELAFNLAYIIGACELMPVIYRRLAHTVCLIMFICSSTFAVWPLIEKYHDDSAAYAQATVEHDQALSKHKARVEAIMLKKAPFEALKASYLAQIKQQQEQLETSLEGQNASIESAKKELSSDIPRTRENARMAIRAYEREKARILAESQARQRQLAESLNQAVKDMIAIDADLASLVAPSSASIQPPTVVNILVQAAYRVMCYLMIVLLFELFFTYYQYYSARINSCRNEK